MDPRKETVKREGKRRKGEAFANLEAHREAILRKARRAFVTEMTVMTANETGSTDATAEPALNTNTNPPTNGVNDNGTAH